MHPHAARCADICEGALSGPGEMQVVPEGVFDALQRDVDVVVSTSAKLNKILLYVAEGDC